MHECSALALNNHVKMMKTDSEKGGFLHIINKYSFHPLTNRSFDV